MFLFDEKKPKKPGHKKSAAHEVRVLLKRCMLICYVPELINKAEN